MNATEIVVREMQRHSAFQRRQFLAERIGKPLALPMGATFTSHIGLDFLAGQTR